ncbi:hypothetical protein JCM17823_15590 [Halorubrum gandharaense]
MFHGTPDCPECGSRFLTFRVRIPSGNVPAPDIRLYRCYRCFAKYTKEDAEEGADGGTGDDAGANTDGHPEHGGPLAVTNVDLSLSAAGSKHAVDRFEVAVRNDGADPIRVSRAALAFDDGEEATTAVDDVVVDPGETVEIALNRSWVHPDQETVTLRLTSEGKTVGATRIDLDEYR